MRAREPKSCPHPHPTDGEGSLTVGGAVDVVLGADGFAEGQPNNLTWPRRAGAAYEEHHAARAVGHDDLKTGGTETRHAGSPQRKVLGK